MAKVSLPYGPGSLSLEIPDERIAGLLVSRAHEYQPEDTETALVAKALDNPIASLPLRELAKGKKKVVIISSDHTRPVPSHVTMPLLLEEVKKGNAGAEITILVATGYHRPTTESELRQKYGDSIVENERIVIHNAFREEDMVNLGTLPSGGALLLNRLVKDADLLAAEGFIEPHFFAGFSGGRKSVLPGIASKDTILANHCAQFIAHEKSRTGILEGNPIHADMVYAARAAGLKFILNVVINAEKKVIKAFAGDFEKAHEEGCRFVNELAGVKAAPAEIVVTTNGGYPLDQNIYQSVKSMTAAEATCKEGGVIIVASQCSDGHGGEGFYRTFAQAKEVREVMDDIIRRGASETVPDQWESQILARVLLKHRVIMVTDAPREMVEDMHMKWAPSLAAALEMAGKMVGDDRAKVTVIPDGVAVIVQQ
ncbi:MAG: nickel-dependent lactate racemase [Peptococcaceae bacterium]|jgi:nickel-dependent lactate racemase|nr:nickel-dependent lactate racemase [Peptococcaceae bacterium]MDH7525918.1 nickel-dependent lactate racemase [Peptococcaceae bacterium]